MPLVLDGELTLITVFDGELSNLLELDGELGIFTNSGGSVYPIYDGETEVTPRAYHEVVLDTDGKVMPSDVTVFRVPYYENPNTDGTTVYIANEV